MPVKGYSSQISQRYKDTKTKCETLIFETFETLQKETRLAVKQKILENLLEICPYTLRMISKLVYDDNIVFNIGSNTLKQCKPGKAYRTNFREFLKLAQILASGKVTKRTEIERLCKHFFSLTDEFHAKWYKRILLKDLRIGVNAATVEKILQKYKEAHHILSIPKVRPMLATAYDSLSDSQRRKLFDTDNGIIWYFEPKIDGFRLITYISADGNYICLSRNGKQVKLAEELLAEDIAKFYERNKSYIQSLGSIALDGELFSSDWNTTMAFQPGAKYMPSKAQLAKVKYYVFDLLEKPDLQQIIHTPYIQRKKLLKGKLGNVKYKHIVYLPEKQTPKSNNLGIDSILAELAQHLIKKGFEGLVAKQHNSPYEQGKRTKYWIKFKQFKTLDLLCVGIEPSDKNPNELGAIIVEYKGKTVKVGSGFTKEQRQHYLQHPEEIVGKIVEVKYMEETKDGSLRHPVFVRIRTDKSKPDA